MADYIPGPDTNFHTWQLNFAAIVNLNLADYGLVAADMTAITAVQGNWSQALTANTTAQAAAQAARQTKDDARSVLEAAIRTVVAKVQANPAVTNASKAAAGITIPGSSPTPAGPPTTAPVAQIETLNRLEHRINFSDSATPTSKAKPPGVRGAQVWMKIGTTPPASAGDDHGVAAVTTAFAIRPGRDG